MKSSPFFLTIAILWFVSCRSEEERPGELRGVLAALDSSRAAQLIIQDTVEHFFDRIRVVDMGLQLGRCFPDTVSRSAVLAQYKSLLQRDVSEFSEREEALLLSELNIIRQWVLNMRFDLFPDTLQLVKSKGLPYGEGAFYTRGKTIVVPQAALRSPNRAELRRTLLHELFHIYSRAHPDKRRELYRIIGFFPLEGPVTIPEELAGKRLVNPDGLAAQFALNVAPSQDDTLLAYPLLRASPPCYDPARESYFAYLDFQLYPLREADGGYRLQLDSSGNSPISYYELPAFFDQIGDNTSYIIHPDEILADNLALLFLMEYDPDQVETASLSARGRQILADMRRVLQP